MPPLPVLQGPVTAIPISTHGLGGSQDLPIPLSLALAGGAAALAVSFIVLALAWTSPRFDAHVQGRPVPWLQRVVDADATRWLLRAVGLAAAAYVTWAAVAGPDNLANPTFGVVYVLLWVGLVPASLLLGPVWRAVNPLRTLHLLLARALGLRPEEGLRPLPKRLGYWPAAAGLFAFVWLELAAPDNTTLPVLRIWFAGYAAAQLAAAAVFGSRWFDQGDAFEVASALWARLSPWGRRPDGRLVVRHPLDNAAGLAPAPGVVAALAVLLGSTAFDGLSNAPVWIRLAQGGILAPTLADTLGLAGVIALVAAAYIAATLLAGRLGSRPSSRQRPRWELPGQFAHTLLPIALGYVVAHYYSLFVLEGQRTLIYLSDPLGTGANWLGTAERGVDASLVSPTGVATLQVSAVVAGHVLGVVLAHDRAVRLFPHPQAVLGQLPLLVLMVGYTLTGLWLLFAG